MKPTPEEVAAKHEENERRLKNLASAEDPSQRLKLLDRIGSGSYGSVHKAVDSETGAVVAIKVVPMSSENDDLGKLVTEVEVLKECLHENITRYINSFVKKQDLWICMEYCGGGSALTLMKALKLPYNEEQISVILRETLKGLVYLHENNRIHRDIKAGNILLTDEGQIKLADFGVSAKLSDKFSMKKTCIGSPYWMAPEVLLVQQTGGSYGVKADIWSLAITAIELAQMKPPLDNLHPMRAMYEIPNSNPPKLKDEKKWSKKFHDFLNDALNKDPTTRPSAADLINHPFIESHKSVSSQSLLTVIHAAQQAKVEKRQRILSRFGVTGEQAVSDLFKEPTLAADLSREVLPPLPPKQLAAVAEATAAAALTDAPISTVEEDHVPAITVSVAKETVVEAPSQDDGTLKAPATIKREEAAAKARDDKLKKRLRGTLSRLIDLSDFLEEDFDDEDLPTGSSVTFAEMLEMDSDIPEAAKHSLSGLMRPGGPVPDNGKILLNQIELAFCEWEMLCADIWGRYVLIGSERGLYATVAGTTLRPRGLIKGLRISRIDVVEECGVLVALGGKSQSLRVYDLSLLRKHIENVFNLDAQVQNQVEEDGLAKQLVETCSKIPETRSTSDYRLTRLGSTIYLTISGKKSMMVFCWAPHPFNRFMEVTSMNFSVTNPIVIGLAAGAERLKSYLVQLKDDLFLIDFNTSEMTQLDFKETWNDLAPLPILSSLASPLTLAGVPTPDPTVATAPPARRASSAGSFLPLPLPVPDRRTSSASTTSSIASLASAAFMMPGSSGAAKLDRDKPGLRMAIAFGDLDITSMMITVDDKTRAIDQGGEPVNDTVIQWTTSPHATVCRTNRYIAAFSDNLVEIRSASTGEPIQSLSSPQLRLRFIKQSTSGLALLVIGFDRKLGSVLYSLAHSA